MNISDRQKRLFEVFCTGIEDQVATGFGLAQATRQAAADVESGAAGVSSPNFSVAGVRFYRESFMPELATTLKSTDFKQQDSQRPVYLQTPFGRALFLKKGDDGLWVTPVDDQNCVYEMSWNESVQLNPYTLGGVLLKWW